MILTCPRCATRYLVDAHSLWTTGRTVQCDACGQRWQANGSGERPKEVPARPTSEPETLEETPPEFPPVPAFTPLEPAAASPEAPETPLFPRTVRRSTGAGHGPPGLGRALAILFLLMTGVAILLLFQDVIVRAAPALAPIYSALGLADSSPAGAGAHG